MKKPITHEAKAWPFMEAKQILKRLNGKAPDKGYVLFETGYGPSGLPHIGTFGEVARTVMVQQAFHSMSDIPTKLFVFSDDMDGLRKVPDNVPNQDILTANIGKPLTQVPDPFGKYESFGHHNNAKLRAFLDSFGFSYEFQSATNLYKSGAFDNTLLTVLDKYKQISDIILPTLRAERQKTYSPFLPISPKTGNVLFVPVREINKNNGTIIFDDEDGTETETPITGGHVKLQWKVDWGMRWKNLNVDYEMFGKDLIPSAQLSKKVCKILGGKAPAGLSYELFLDEAGQKISKSKGNGLTIEEWLKYAPAKSLSYYMFHRPKTSKRLHLGSIPKAVDEHLTHLHRYSSDTEEKRIENPAWHIYGGTPPSSKEVGSFNYSTLLNIASAAQAENKDVLWGFINNYDPSVTPQEATILDEMTEHAVAYYQDVVRPTNKYREPSKEEAKTLEAIKSQLIKMPDTSTAEDIQTGIYSIGKSQASTDLKSWFKSLYEVLFGQSNGPRLGSFIKFYGIQNTIGLIDKSLSGELANGVCTRPTSRDNGLRNIGPTPSNE